MQKTHNNWSEAPLFHAEKNIIPASTKKNQAMDCWGSIPRLNIGNLHEIKRYWQLSEIRESA